MQAAPGRIVQEVVKRVATETGRDPKALPPLYETVDPDALAVAVETLDTGRVTFSYAGCTVTVRADDRFDADCIVRSEDVGPKKASTWAERDSATGSRHDGRTAASRGGGEEREAIRADGQKHPISAV